MGECVTISSITINLDGLDDIVITDFANDTLLDWGVIPAGIILTKTANGATVCLEDGASIVSPYTINVSYTDSCDNRAEASLVVTFEDCSCIAPTVEADGPYTETVCPGTAATIVFDSTVTSGTGPFTYAWTFGDGGTSDLEDPSHPYPIGAGVYNVTLVVTNACGDSTYNTTVTITECINHKPVIASIPSPQYVINGQPFTYDVNATDEDGDTLEFSLLVHPTDMTINSTTGVITWSHAYCPSNRCWTCPVDVTVKVKDDGCCGTEYSTKSFTVIVREY